MEQTKPELDLKMATQQEGARMFYWEAVLFGASVVLLLLRDEPKKKVMVEGSVELALWLELMGNDGSNCRSSKPDFPGMMTKGCLRWNFSSINRTSSRFLA